MVLAGIELQDSLGVRDDRLLASLIFEIAKRGGYKHNSTPPCESVFDGYKKEN